MARVEAAEETRGRADQNGASDLLIALAAPTDPVEVRAALAETFLKADAAPEDPSLASLSVTVALPALPGGGEASTSAIAHDRLTFLPYTPPPEPAVIPSLASFASYQAIFGAVRDLGVRACAVVAPDLGALKDGAPLFAPVLAGRCDLAMPIYPMKRFEGLLNSSILSPLTRALYGKRVRFPLAPDFGLSAGLLQDFDRLSPPAGSQAASLLWPATEAALRNRKICQVQVALRHAFAEGVDLSTVMNQTVGPLFAEMEVNAAFWQRVRGSQPAEILGMPSAAPIDGAPVDVRPMLESFSLGFRNLQEVWGLVLPPVTLLELKKLSRMDPESFRLPDEVWVRIVYDFALAYRLRTLGRGHLLGALTPLYLGWVASHVLEVAKMRPPEAEQRLERLARAYEDGKPYLLSRWRWPDRFNP